MYLTYIDYVGMGGDAEEAVFDRFNHRAQTLITRLTHGRVSDESPVRDAVRYCAFDLIAAMRKDEDSGEDRNVVASMSNDGMSVAYAAAGGDASQVCARRYAGIVRGYLEWEEDKNGVLLLYAGY